jgi:hypothetical protein
MQGAKCQRQREHATKASMQTSIHIYICMPDPIALNERWIAQYYIMKYINITRYFKAGKPIHQHH